MAEVQVSELEVGNDYSIQMVGRYKNAIRGSGKAIGRGFIRTVTFDEIKHNRDLQFGGISPDVFNDYHVFVQFSEVVPIDGAECGICDYRYFPAVFTAWYDMDSEQKKRSSGGYRFFEMPDLRGGKKRKRKRKSRSRRRRNTRKRRRKKTKKRRRKKRTKRRR
tara:strand:- start:567 stop:1055 length:489 start_codon:yes stop_codon:yes gene_type:complete